MMPRLTLFIPCLASGLALLAVGLLVPAHWHALDRAVVQCAGNNTPRLVESARSLAATGRLGVAQVLFQAAESQNLPGHSKSAPYLAALTAQTPNALFWGDDRPVENWFAKYFQPADGALPWADFIIRPENREAALTQLAGSPMASVQALLHSRTLTQTVIFSPSASAAGQAFDAAVATGGLLLAGGHLTAGLSEDLFNRAFQANDGKGSQSLEDVLLDFTTLGERFNWDQLTAFTAHIPNAEVLHQLAGEVRGAGEQLPVLFAAVQLSGRPAVVAEYLANFKATGLVDLGASLRYGAGGVGALVERQQRFYDAGWERRAAGLWLVGGILSLAADFVWSHPGLALAAKWLIYLLAGFLLALPFTVPPAGVPGGEREFRWYREGLILPGFLLVVLLLSEPFLVPDSQKGEFALRLPLPTLGAAVPGATAGMPKQLMNATILLTLVIFFTLQALIYVACLRKLAEIRRQQTPARMKLKLLENEDHLFDAGLYIGFVGTISSLIIASMGLVKFSLMAAYSSTSFGIIFVVIFKVFHLRPERRKLLLEAEAQTTVAKTRVPAAVPAAPVTP